MNTKAQVPKEAGSLATPGRDPLQTPPEYAVKRTQDSIFSGLDAILSPELQQFSLLREFARSDFDQGHPARGPACRLGAGPAPSRKKLLRVSSKLALALETSSLNHGPKNIRFNVRRNKGSNFSSEASERSALEDCPKQPFSPKVEVNPTLDAPVYRVSPRRNLSLQAGSQHPKNPAASHRAACTGPALPTPSCTKEELARLKQTWSQVNSNLPELESTQRSLLELCKCYVSKKTGKSFPEEEADLSKKVEGSGLQVEAALQQHSGLWSSVSFQTADHESIFRMCSESKEKSLEVQALLQTMNGEQLGQFAGYLSTKLESLLVDRFASYVVQHLIEVDAKTLARVTRIVVRDVRKFATNEYSSRLMQRIFVLDPDFCKQVLIQVPCHFDEIIDCFSGSIMLTKLVGIVDDDSYYAFVIKILEQNKEYLRKAYFNRMLSTLVSCCSEHMLDRIVQQVKSHVWVLINDKFGNCVLQTFFKRNHTKGVSLVIANCLKHINTLLIRRFPKLMLINLVQDGMFDQHTDRICQTLSQLKPANMMKIMQRKESCSLFLLLASRSSLPIRESLFGFLRSSVGLSLGPKPANALKNLDSELYQHLLDLHRLSLKR